MNGRNYYGRNRYPQPSARFGLANRSSSSKRSASPTARLVAALCHLSLALNLFTYGGGIAFCLLIYLLAVGRTEFLTRQAGKALLAQLIVWGLIAPAWCLQLLLPGWLGGIFFWPWAAVIWFVAIVVETVKGALCL